MSWFSDRVKIEEGEQWFSNNWVDESFNKWTNEDLIAEEKRKYRMGYENVDWGQTTTRHIPTQQQMEILSKSMTELREARNQFTFKTLEPAVEIKEKEEKMSGKTVLNWVGPSTTLWFKDLELGEHFTVDTEKSRGAVYRKVLVNKSFDKGAYFGLKIEAQLEIASCEVFQPTNSPIKRIEVSINVAAPKPSIY